MTPIEYTHPGTPPTGDRDPLDTFLADTMAGILDTLNAVLNPGRRLANLGHRRGLDGSPERTKP